MAYTIFCDEGFTFTAAELLSPHFVKVADRDFSGALAAHPGDAYLITMSPAFSGSFEAACQAREEALRREPDRRVFVLDTRTAFAGEMAVARQLHDLLLSGKAPEQAVLETQDYIERMSTVGVLDRADVAREKHAVVRGALKGRFGRKLLMVGGQDGRLHIRGRSRGASLEALTRLAEKQLARRTEKPQRCVITYSGCPERAKELGRQLKKLCGFRELVITPADRAATRLMGSGTMLAAF